MIILANKIEKPDCRISRYVPDAKFGNDSGVLRRDE
jgi:hypothetical protein